MSLLSRTLRRVFAQPDFVVAFAVLGVAALGLNVCTDYLRLHYRKEAVPLRVAALDGPEGIPATLGTWVQVSRDKAFDPDLEHILGTKLYLDRTYVNSAVLGATEVAAVKDIDNPEHARTLAAIESDHPEAIVHIGVFYYTGLVDTVAHIPERCYIADGFDVTSYGVQTGQKVGKYPDGSDRVIDFRNIEFEDTAGRNRVAKNVAYLFHVNGHYESDPLGVRRRLQNLFERYGYYAKVELMTVGERRAGESRTQAQQRSLAAFEDLLSGLLPETERCLPDWQALHAARAAAR